MLATAVKKKKRKQLTAAEMLKAGSLADRDAATRQRRLGIIPETEEEELPGLDKRDYPDDDGDDTPLSNTLRAASLELPGVGDIAANKENEAPPPPSEKGPFMSPPPVKGNGKGSFKAIDPVNILVPLEGLKHFIEKQTGCPSLDCKPEGCQCTMEMDIQQYGLATEIHIKCKCCMASTSIAPPLLPPIGKKADPPNNVGVWKYDWNDTFKKMVPSKFHRYDINYHAGLLMQKLGDGLRALGMIMAFISIAAGTGSPNKWNILLTKIGVAEHEVCAEVIDENLAEELRATKKVANNMLADWLESDEGKDATPDQKEAKLDELLHKERGKIGIYMSADGAWQRRKIGKSGGNSKTGHNFGLGRYTQKIISAQSYSQSCALCEKHESQRPPTVAPNHRCPQNFPTNVSSKAMKPRGTVQHCIDICNSRHECYVHTLITDDDSKTKANCDYSEHEKCEIRHPGSLVNGKIPSRRKRALGWPTDGNGDLKQLDPGRLPRWVPKVQCFLADCQHRIRGIGTIFYDCRKKYETIEKTNAGLGKGECANGKRNAGFYIKLNQGWTNEDFENRASSLVCHMFGDHDSWCTKLQAEKIEDPAEKLKKDNPKKYRDPTPSDAAKKLYEKVKEKVLPLLTPEKMREVYHTFSTQKNEALQKIMTVYCPKDQFFGGSMQLHDRLRYVVIEDSLGVHVGMGRLFHHMGLAPLHTIMSQWAGTRDNSNAYMQNYRQKLEVRQKRAAVAIAKMKAGVLKDMKAEKAGETYKTGVANEQEPPKKKAKTTKAKTTTTKTTKKKVAKMTKKKVAQTKKATTTKERKAAPKETPPPQRKQRPLRRLARSLRPNQRQRGREHHRPINQRCQQKCHRRCLLLQVGIQQMLVAMEMRKSEELGSREPNPD